MRISPRPTALHEFWHHTRYRGLPKVTLQHAFTAVAINLIRLDTYWNSPPQDPARTSHLTRLDHALAA